MEKKISSQNFLFCLKHGYIKRVDNQFYWAERDREIPMNVSEEEKNKVEKNQKCLRCQCVARVDYMRPFCVPCQDKTITEEMTRAEEERKIKQAVKELQEKAKAEAERKAAIPKNWHDARKKIKKEEETAKKRKIRLAKQKEKDKTKEEQIKAQLHRNIKTGNNIEKFCKK